MIPTPQEHGIRIEEVETGLDGERVVISGMSGLYPDCNSVKELSHVLYNKINPVVLGNTRWNYNHPEVSQATGMIPHLDRFDAQFFKVHYRLSNNMDSMGRKILEQAYQAIYDAGVNPDHLSGRNIGVYIGSSFSETEKIGCYFSSSRKGLGITGCSKTMFANRISYWLNAKGPSLSIDAGCCSSTTALELAYLAISRSECEAAIVGGANLCLHPHSSVHYGRIMTLAMDGKTKSFDQNADGVAKSEAINVLYLQKAKNALRIYADVLYVKSEFTKFLEGETGPKFGLYRDPKVNAKFLRDFYKTANVSPKDVEYVEAVGSAVPEADKAELESIDEVFCKDRDQPLLVGSVTSNIGYSEAAAGISAVTKVLLGYHNGELAANLHYEHPRQDVAALREGRINILREHQRFNRSYAAVNGISVTGVNAHVLLHGHYKPKDIHRYKSAIPHLVTISGRKESSVKKILDDLKTRPIDPEELALFLNIHETRISGHMARGFALLDTNEDSKTKSLCEKVNYFDDIKRPLWFVYSGMGSQWAGMGSELMRIQIFAAAIERCRKVLEPQGVDIIHIITSRDKTIFDNILNSFVGIAAIQIGLTDILRDLGLVPDKIIGHSVGELGCAYADGCFTAEEMILSAYSRGLVSIQTPFIHGSMAAVGIGYEKVSKIVPPEIEVACHNGPESSTISGPAETMRKFVAELSNKDIFAKEVPCSNIAYHSRYIAEAGPGLLKHLSKVIKTPKLRSDRWVSTSVPQHRWNESSAKYSSAEYHTNNLLSPVLFEETSRLIPPNAVLVEIAPHGLLQAILKRSLPDSCRHVPLTRRGHPDNAVFILEAIGKLYMEGYNPKICGLYPKIEFPVSTGTPMLSHQVEWEHQEKWNLPLYLAARRRTAAACKFVISIHDNEHKYLQGHEIRGKILYPFAGALVAVWDTLAMSLGVAKKQLSVQFRDVHLHSQPVLHDQRQLKLSVELHRGTGRFEVLVGQSRVITGFIISYKKNVNRSFLHSFESIEEVALNSEAIYQLLYDRDYSYQGEFQSIVRSNLSFTEAEILWNNNWITFIDALIQVNTLRLNHDTVSQPKHIRRLCIDINQHFNNKITKVDDKFILKANVSEIHDYTRCGGVLIQNFKFNNLPPLTTEIVTLMPRKFISHFNSKLEVDTALQVALQTVAENIDKDIVNVVEIVNQNIMSAFTDIDKIVNDIPDLKIVFEQIEKDRMLDKRDHYLADTDVLLIQNLSDDNNLCQTLYRVLRRDAFVLNVEYNSTPTHVRPSGLYRIVSSYDIGVKHLELISWRPSSITATSATSAVSVRTLSDLAMAKSTKANLPSRHKLLIIANYPPLPGLKDLIKQWRRDADNNQVYLIMINHKIADDVHLDEMPELNLSFNVLDHGTWGGEYYVPWKEHKTIKRDVALQSRKIGELDSLHWVELSETIKPGTKVTVQYASLSDLDVKRATGILPFRNVNGSCETRYGMDYSGVTDRGERVMGIIRGGAVSGRVVAQPELLWPVPAHWSMEDATTVPLPYAQAFYCLGIRAQIIPGMSILVHDGLDAFGQAVISIALGVGCEVFTTVSDIRKKHFLRKLFPALQEDHIGNSKNHSFGDMVLNITRGKGCNIVICGVKGELKNVSQSCCAAWGIIIDTVQIPHQENYEFGMSSLEAERNYIIVDFYSLFQNNEVNVMKDLQLMMSEGIARGYVRPLTRVTYSPHDSARAFQLMASSRHRGCVVISLKDSVTEYEPRLTCSPDHCHMILSDEEHIGFQFAERLIKRGAKNIHIQNPQTSNYGRYKIQSWQNQGVNVKVRSSELKESKSVISFVNESNRLGTVEGIYVIASKTDDKKIHEVMSLLANLDLASRKLCPAVKYFVVLSTDYNIGQQICFTRAQDRLPATAIQFPKLKKDTKSSETCLTWKDAIDASERAVRSSHSVVMAYTQPRTNQTLLHDIVNIAGIKLPEDINDNTTLQELGVELDKSESIQAYLRESHNMSLSEEEIIALTVQRISDMNDIISGSEFKKIEGLQVFFSYVDPDELLATTEFVMLPTLTHNASTRDDEFDINLKYLCIVPGLEGHHEKFRVLCERLKVPAFVLQPGLDRNYETIQETAQRYAKILLKKFELKKDFYLLGYESGLLVALEIAAILEDHGLIGTVFCLGTTPEELQVVLDEQLSDFDTANALQNVVTCHMYALIAGEKSKDLEKTLRKIPLWKDKIEACVRAIRGKVAHSVQYAGALIDAAYARIRTVREYTADIHPLKSRLVLLHATSPDPAPNTLQRYSQQPVVVHELHVSLANVTRDLRCAAIINQYFDKDILDVFGKRNICETYLINADMFISNDVE